MMRSIRTKLHKEFLANPDLLDKKLADIRKKI